MPSSPEDDDDSASSIAPVAKRRASQPNIAPLRISAVKTKPTTPNKRVSGNGIKTPNTAPARPKSGTQKRNEPTLLGDFLLGRPSPGRKQRRKSLEAVKQELKVANVGTIQVPGGVKDRVKQWQKTNAAVVVTEDPNAESEEDESKPSWKDKVPEGVDEMSVDEDERLRIKFRKGTKPGRRKEKEDDEVSETHSKSTTAPKKRVVSDEHWRKTRTPNRKSSANRNAGQKIPKDFLVKTVVKEPLAQRVQDWIKVSEIPPPAKEPKKSRPTRSEPRASKLSLPVDGIRVRPISSSSVSLPKDDGTRVRPLSSSSISRPKHDGIRIKPLDDSTSHSTADDGIRVKSIPKDGSKRRPKDSKGREEVEVITPTHRPEKYLRPPAEFSKSRTSSRSSRRSSRKLDEQDDTLTAMTPSPPEKSKRKVRKSETPSDFSEIPFGSSAFSVLELPLGAEANTMPSRRPPPKRNPSFGVPKVLKKVYNAVHDTSEPQRGGPNQPASIESWLHKTSDPFTERSTPPQSVAGISDTVPSTEHTQQEDDESKFETNNTGTVRRKRRSRDRKSLDEIKTEILPRKESSPPLEIPKTRDAFPSMDRPSPISPSGLKRSPATRNASSPKSVKKSLFKEAILDAFKGESAVTGKSKDTNPFLEITGLRERDANRTPSYFQRQDRDFESEDTPTKENPFSREKSISEEPSPLRTKPLPTYTRRPPTAGYGHRLSTIASIETFKSSSATDTASDISQTTITQDTVLSRTTDSSISRRSNNRPNKPGVKRRLTKHSDLLSMLSLPDNVQQQGRSTSIKSARSVRTTRSRIETATSNDFMKELAEDEAKYIRELKTLVDGVIPVLLTCVLSRSDSAVAAGLFNPNAAPGTDKTLTKPIVDMGIALERLKSLHKRIPLEDPDAFFTWANQARKIYHDYLLAWRSGFQDVVVNLAPASRSTSAEGSKPMADEMARNSRGDVIRSNGERADVAYLLKRPLVRVKYLTKALNGLTTLKPVPFREKVRDDWNVEETFTRKRSREEDARRVDQAANATDPTRARNPRNLAPMDNIKIDQTRQVCAKDYFSLDISHSNGQRIECRVEILMRDKISDPNDSDILICEVDNFRRFLLFPPISKDCISARMGDNKDQLVVMIRGVHESSEWQEEWKETFILEAEDEDAAEDWLEMFGIVPVPPQVRKTIYSEPVLSELSVSVLLPKRASPSAVDGDIPIGERRRREAEEIENKQEKRRSSHTLPSSSTSISNEEDSVVGDHVTDAVIDLNDAMNKAGTLLPTKRTRASRYHSKIPSLSSNFVPEMSGGLDPYPENTIRSKSPHIVEDRTTSPELSSSTTKLPHIPKLRSPPAITYSSTPLKESMRPEFEATIKQPLTPETKEDAPPPPPPHRTLTPTGLKNTPVLDSATPKAKARRSSSPLKHEYQPSTESGTSSSEVSRSESSSESETESDYSSDYTDEDEDEDELEAIDMPSALPGDQIYSKRVSPDGSMYSIPNSTLAPSNSASQGPYRGVPAPLPTDIIRKNTAYVFGWSESNGIWVPLFPEPCSIVVSPGLVESFRMSAAHSSPLRNADGSEASEVPLLAQVVTPVVLLRQSNALDIEIRVPPVQTSVLVIARGFKIIRYRATSNEECTTLYNALHRARLENPTYKRLEEERRVNGFGTNNFDCAPQPRRKSWIFGRKKSYRASTRAPSEGTESEQSGNTRTSALSALRSMSGGAFNIARSTIDNQGSVRPSSNYTSNPSDYSSPTPPRTPTSGSLMGSTYSSGILAHRGSENMKIRLYELHSNSKWNDLGPACLTVTIPAPGMRQASSLNHGIERRIIITRKAATQSMFSINTLASLAGGGTKANDDDNYIFLDIILGASCFSKVGRTGVCANVWEDIAGPNGEVGMIGATGGVAGRTRKWLFQTGCQSDANWVFSLCAIGRNC